MIFLPTFFHFYIILTNTSHPRKNKCHAAKRLLHMCGASSYFWRLNNKIWTGQVHCATLSLKYTNPMIMLGDEEKFFQSSIRDIIIDDTTRRRIGKCVSLNRIQSSWDIKIHCIKRHGKLLVKSRRFNKDTYISLIQTRTSIPQNCDISKKWLIVWF